MNEAQQELKAARQAVLDYLDGMGISITNETILNKFINLYLEGVSYGLGKARQIYNGKGGEANG